MKVILLSVAIGLVAGLLGALCGVGGGIVLVPAFVSFFGFDQKRAVATSLAVIIVTALAATVNNAKEGNLNRLENRRCRGNRICGSRVVWK